MLMYLIFPSTVVGVLVALVFMRTDYEFKKWEGGVLIAVYGVFLVLWRCTEEDCFECHILPR